MRMFKPDPASLPARRRAALLAVIGAGAVLLLPGTSARAQLLNQLQNALGSSQGGAGALPSVNQASPTNLAGVLEYCVQNNYLNGGAASSVKDTLLKKVTGSSQQGTADSQYQAGSRGLLQTGQGQSFGLGGGGLKAELTNEICALVLQHAKSLL